MSQAARRVRAAELEIKPYHIAGDKDLCEVSLARIMLTASLATWLTVSCLVTSGYCDPLTRSLTGRAFVNYPVRLWADSEAGTREY